LQRFGRTFLTANFIALHLHEAINTLHDDQPFYSEIQNEKPSFQDQEVGKISAPHAMLKPFHDAVNFRKCHKFSGASWVYHGKALK